MGDKYRGRSRRSWLVLHGVHPRPRPHRDPDGERWSPEAARARDHADHHARWWWGDVAHRLVSTFIMPKALSSVCLALLICFGGSAWAGKPKIAILGLEAAPGPSGTQEPETT